MELVTSLASTAVLGIGSTMAFNTLVKTLGIYVLMALRGCVTVGLTLQIGDL